MTRRACVPFLFHRPFSALSIRFHPGQTTGVPREASFHQLSAKTLLSCPATLLVALSTARQVGRMEQLSQAALQKLARDLKDLQANAIDGVKVGRQGHVRPVVR